ncbi:hypothetical protein K8S19_01815 [bacterium]|nr:hypothetical protein [bacterium]
MRRLVLSCCLLFLSAGFFGCVAVETQPEFMPDDSSDPNPRVIRKIRVGLNPIGVQVTGDDAYVYVANSGDNSVSKISTATWQVVSNLQVEKNPAWLTIDSEDKKIYITSREGRAVSLLDVQGNYLLNAIDLPYTPEKIVLHPEKLIAYVGSSHSSHLMVIDIVRAKVIQNMVLNGECIGLAITPDGSDIYVSTRADRYNLQVISTADHGVVFRTDVGSSPQAVAIDTKGEYAYVANHGSNDLTVVHIPTRHPVISIPVGQGPLDVALTPSGKYAYVACQFDNSVVVVDTAKNQVVTKIELEVVPYGMDFSSNGSRLFVANYKQKSQGKNTQGISGPQLTLGTGAGNRIDNNMLLVIDTRSYH